MSVEVLLFDLGGVLVDFTGVSDIGGLLPDHASPAEILDRWRRCEHSQAFGVGQLGAQEYVERFVRDWGITLEPSAFIAEYKSWARGLYPGAKELLAELRPRYRLAALSNSNELHWERNTNEIGVVELFEVAISSHQVGLSKPDPAIYRVAVDRLGVRPEAIAFFDDSRENVKAATDVGMRAFEVQGVDDLRSCLVANGLL